MTQANDDDSLDWRGSDLRRQYRQLPVDSVPADLDRLVVDHARAAVAGPAAARRSWIHWVLPFCLVGSALLAATLVLQDTRVAAVPLVAPNESLSTAAVMAEQSALSDAASPPAAAAAVANLAVSPRAARSPTATAPTTTALGSEIVKTQLSAPPAPTHTSHPVSTIGPASTIGPVSTIDPASAIDPASTIDPVSAIDPASAIDARPQLPAANPYHAQQTAPIVTDVLPAAAISAAAATGNEPGLDTASPNADAGESSRAAAAGGTETSAMPDAEPETLFEDLDALRVTTLSPAKLAAAEGKLADIRYLRETGRRRAADIAWRRFMREFPDYPVAAEDNARPHEE